GEVADPDIESEDASKAQEGRVLELDGHGQREVQRVKDWNLRDHWQAAAHRIDVVLAVQAERLFLQLLRVVLVLSPQRVDLRLKRLHRLHRPHALDRDANDPILGFSRSLPVRCELEARRLRDQGCEVPGAVEADPLALQLLGGDSPQVIDTIDVTARGPDDFGWALTGELLFGRFF